MRSVAMCLLVTLSLTAQGEVPVERLTTAIFDAVIEPEQFIHLSASVDGILETVTVERGDLVMKGEVLATIESSMERSNLKIAGARAEQVAALKRQEANMEYFSRKLQQDEKLFAKDIISEQEIDQSRLEKRLAEAGLLQAKEDLRLAQLEKERAEALLALRTIRSPFAGVVVDRLLSPGELVTEVSGGQILTLAQIDPLRVEVILLATLFGQVRVGMKAEVRPQGPVSAVYQATVSVVDRVVDAASGTFRVRLSVPNSDHRLPSGLRASVRFLP